MFNHEIFAVSLARSVELARMGAATEQQKAALQAVHALTSIASAMVRVYQGMLTVDDVGIPDSLQHVGILIETMSAHGVAEIAIARGATPLELLALIRGLAADPEGEDEARRIKLRLRDARSMSVMVIPTKSGEPDAASQTSRITQAFVVEGLGAPADVVPYEDEEPLAPPVSAPEEEVAATPGELPAMLASVDFAFDEVTPAQQAAVDEVTFLNGEGPLLPEELPAVAEALQSDVLSADTPLGAALAEVARDPYGYGILDRLSALSREVQSTLKSGEVQAALHALSALIAWEPYAPEGTPRNSYAIVLRRTLDREHLTRLASYLRDPRLGPEATSVMKRAGADAVEVLLGLLAKAEGMKQRRVYVAALREMPEGPQLLIHMLGHHQWYMVRNVADLIGELRIEEAVPALSECLAHGDVRVRRAVAVALAKIGTVGTIEPLRRVLREGERDLRIVIAGSIGGPTARALAMPLVAISEEEEDEGVLGEYYRALGRIGTPDAIQALAAAATPGGRVFGRRPVAPRLAAVDGLKMAGGKVAEAALQALAKDGDRAVREASARALEEMRSAPRTDPPPSPT
jgi:HEAT repeat protein